MRKILFVFAFMMAANFVMAQDSDDNRFEMGTIYANASSNFNAIFSDETLLNLNVGGGFFLMDNLMAGINFSYIDFGFGDDTAIDLNARYYIFDNIYAGAGYNTDTEVFYARAGYNFFLNDTFSLEPSFVLPFDDGSDPSLSIFFSAFF